MLETLKMFDSIFRKCEFMEQLIEYPDLASVIRSMNEICLKEGVIGIHYTRAVRKEIEANGLILSTGKNRRQLFIQQHGQRFTNEQLQKISNLWENYFNNLQAKVRDNRIWFAFTLLGLENGGAGSLLSYYGGEQVNMPLTDDVEIVTILKELGEPLIVECFLDPRLLKTFAELPWGKIWLSTYHLTINSEAYQFDVDAYQEVPVHAQNIMSITNCSKLLS